MLYKATVTFSLLFLAIVGSAQNDGGAKTSAQPPSNSISSTTTSQARPSSSGIPISTPTASDGNASPTDTTRPSGCYPHNGLPSAIPIDRGVFSSSGHSASSQPHFSCEPDSASAIPTGIESVSAHGAGALPSTFTSGPIQSGVARTRSHHHHDGNFTPPTGSSKPSSSGPGQKDPPAATATTSFGKFDCL